MDDVTKNGNHKSPLGYNNVDWFLDEVIKLEIKMIFYLKKTIKKILVTAENEENYRKTIICGL